jgi:hypothetical protein
MPYKNKADRNYKREYENYDGTAVVKKRRAERNAARNKLLKEGKVHKGDGKDVDHKTPLSKGGSAAASNLRVVTAHANRSYKRNKDHSVK